MRHRTSLVVALATVSFSNCSGIAQESGALFENRVADLISSSANLSSQASHLSQDQWIRLADEGSIRGSVSGLVGSDYIRQAKVKIALIQDGVIVLSGITDVEGDFIIDNGKPGTYSLVATGENQLAVCSLTVLDASEGSHLPDRAHIRSLNPASPRVTELLRSNTMPMWTVGSSQNRDPIAATRNVHGSSEVRIDARGGISGTLSRANAGVDLSSTLVYLVRDGKEVARTRVSSNGDYRFESVVPGGYGLVASGPEGIAAVGFSAVAGDLAINEPLRERFVKRLVQDDKATIPAPAPAQDKLNVELAEPNCYVPAEVIPIEESVVCDEAPCCPTMLGGWGGGMGSRGGGGGGGGGGFGAGGGIGGLGTLAAVGALATIAVVQASDEGDQSPIVSPIK